MLTHYGRTNLAEDKLSLSLIRVWPVTNTTFWVNSNHETPIHILLTKIVHNKNECILRQIYPTSIRTIHPIS